MKVSDMKEGLHYWITHKDGVETCLVYCYRSNDVLGVGFNAANGGGFIPLTDLHTAEAVLDYPSYFVSKIEKIQQCHDIQGQDGNWNYDEYMRGLYNGLELVLAILNDREPIYKDHIKR